MRWQLVYQIYCPAIDTLVTGMVITNIRYTCKLIFILDFRQVYIPCILFVTVSWISFIIDPAVRFLSIFYGSYFIYFSQPLITSKNFFDGFVSNACQGGAREDVSPSHPLPRHHQRLQQRQASVSRQFWLPREKKRKSAKCSNSKSQVECPGCCVRQAECN